MKRLLVLMLLFIPVPLLAETYEWTDDHGTVNFTEDLSRVPKKYRKRVKVLGGDDAASPAPEPESPKPVKRKAEEGAPEKKALYGGRDENAWRSEFAAIKAELKAAEQDLADYQQRLSDTSRMSRSEYKGLQAAVKLQEQRIQDVRKRLDALRISADRAGVPSEIR